jgi:hypothetical protein
MIQDLGPSSDRPLFSGYRLDEHEILASIGVAGIHEVCWTSTD